MQRILVMAAAPVGKSQIAYKIGEKGDRPWGTWEVTAVGDDNIRKKIVVSPGQSLSVQSHTHREEFWKGVKGKGFAQVGDKVFEITPGITVHIPKGAIHRLYTEADAVEIEEIQKGKILDENDIIRYEDRYGRETKER